jgi:hypothetical protein
MVNPQYEIEHGDGKVTAWGGMSLMKEVLERIGMSRHLAQAPPPPLPKRVSNRGYSPSVVVESYMVNVWMGCCRMRHTEVLRRDDTLMSTVYQPQTWWHRVDWQSPEVRIRSQQTVGGICAAADASIIQPIPEPIHEGPTQ